MTIDRDEMLPVHLAHCNMGDYEGVCKYGDADCPALASAYVAPDMGALAVVAFRRATVKAGNELPDVDFTEEWTEYEHGVYDYQKAIQAIATPSPAAIRAAALAVPDVRAVTVAWEHKKTADAALRAWDKTEMFGPIGLFKLTEASDNADKALDAALADLNATAADPAAERIARDAMKGGGE